MSDGLIVVSKHGTVVTGPDGMKLFRMLQLRGALKLEMIGLKTRGGSAYACIKREFGLRGSREKVLAAFEVLVQEQSAKVPRVTKEEG